MILSCLLLTGLASAGEEPSVSIKANLDGWMAGDQTSAFTVDADGTQGGQGVHNSLRKRNGKLDSVFYFFEFPNFWKIFFSYRKFLRFHGL